MRNVARAYSVELWHNGGTFTYLSEQRLKTGQGVLVPVNAERHYGTVVGKVSFEEAAESFAATGRRPYFKFIERKLSKREQKALREHETLYANLKSSHDELKRLTWAEDDAAYGCGVPRGRSFDIGEYDE